MNCARISNGWKSNTTHWRFPKTCKNLALLRFKLEQGRLYLAKLEDNTAFLWREDFAKAFRDGARLG